MAPDSQESRIRELEKENHFTAKDLQYMNDKIDWIKESQDKMNETMQAFINSADKKYAPKKDLDVLCKKVDKLNTGSVAVKQIRIKTWGWIVIQLLILVWVIATVLLSK